MTNLSSISSGLEPYSPSPSKPWNRRRVAHLLRRTRLGAPNRQEIDFFLGLSPSEAVDKLFEFRPVPSPPDWVNEPISVPPDKELERQRRKELMKWWLSTAYSDKSVRERMVYFWSNHFVVEATKVKNPQMLYKINSLFRTFSVGNLKDLTKAVGKEPAMLIYLDGIKSTKQNLNENFCPLRTG